MKKIDDRFIDFTYANSNSVSGDDVPYDGGDSVKDKIDSVESGAASSSHTHPASEVTDFDTEVGNHTDVTTNTGARHTQDTDTGTTQQLFQIQSGSNGVRLKNVGSDATATLYVRNNLDNDDASLVVKNLTVNGTTTTIESETVEIADNIITLNSDVTSGAPVVDAGIEIRRGDETNASHIWDETNDEWKCGEQGSEIPIARKATATLNSGASWLGSGPYYQDVSHNLATRPVHVQCYEATTWVQIVPSDIDLTDTNTARIYMPDQASSLEVVVVG